MKLAGLQKRRRARRGKRASREHGRRKGPQATIAGRIAAPLDANLPALKPAPNGDPCAGGSGGPQVQRYDHLRLSERVLLVPGDKIRVSGGPYYEGHDAAGDVVKIKMAERGIMVFLQYCEFGDSRWIVARGKSGYAALHIGIQERAELLPGLVRRPYRVRKLRPKRRRPK